MISLLLTKRKMEVKRSIAPKNNIVLRVGIGTN
jgi:hypothetical protein